MDKLKYIGLNTSDKRKPSSSNTGALIAAVKKRRSDEVSSANSNSL
jgi:hypothetical protein